VSADKSFGLCQRSPPRLANPTDRSWKTPDNRRSVYQESGHTHKHFSPPGPHFDLDSHALSDQPTAADGYPLSDQYASPHPNLFAYSPSPTTPQR
jgi:hypothetical protein